MTTVKAQDAKAKCPPVARVDDVKETIHGTVVSDPYRWLEDQNSPETRAWIDGGERVHAGGAAISLPAQDAIAKRLGELIKVDTSHAGGTRRAIFLFEARGGRGFVRPLYAAAARTARNRCWWIRRG